MHPHLSVPALLLTAVYAVAVALALTAPGHTVAGLVVLTGLVSRWAIRHRHRGPIAEVMRPADAPAT